MAAANPSPVNRTPIMVVMAPRRSASAEILGNPASQIMGPTTESSPTVSQTVGNWAATSVAVGLAPEGCSVHWMMFAAKSVRGPTTRATTATD